MNRHSLAAIKQPGKKVSIGVLLLITLWCKAGRAHQPPALPSSSPFGKIQVSANVQVSKERAAQGHFEVIVAADPKNPNLLLAGSIIQHSVGDHLRTRVVGYRSRDKGKTWQVALEPKDTVNIVFDPTVAFGPDGSVYFGCMFSDPLDYTKISRSRDGGLTWEPPTRIQGGYDRPYLAVDCTGGKYKGTLYYASRVGDNPGVRVSHDGGRTFGTVQTFDVAGFYSMINPMALSDGTLIQPYTVRSARYTQLLKAYNNQPLTSPFPTGYIGVRRFRNGGAAILPEQSPISACWTTQSSGIPMLAADSGSGVFKDRLYLVWSDAFASGQRVKISESQDKGQTWSKPMLLSEQPNSDENAMPNASHTASAMTYDAFLPSVAVNREGMVGVCWYDTRQTPEGKTGWDVRFRASRDGGKTWLPSVRVSEGTNLFPPGNNWGGDTAGLVADASGGFHPVWVDNRAGVPQVWTATVTISAKP